MEGKRPAIVGRKLRKARHRGSIDPLADHLIEPKKTALPCPRPVGERNRRRIELRGIGAMPVARQAVAGGAILTIELCAAGQIGCAARRKRNRIGAEQSVSESTGLGSHCAWIGYGRDRGLESRGGGHGGSLLRRYSQRNGAGWEG